MRASSPTGRPPESRGRPAVEAFGVTKRFGPTVALDDVQLRVEDRESHALVGRNGAGKSTLVSIITGLQAAERRDDLVSRPAGAERPHDRDGWRRAVACVYQKSTIIPTLSVAENVFLNRQQTSASIISWKTMRSRGAATHRHGGHRRRCAGIPRTS